MTEAEWLAASDLHAMLEFARQRGILSNRKWRLFAVACCQPVSHLMHDARSRNAVIMAERFADGAATADELDVAFDEAFDVEMEFRDKVRRGLEREVPEGYAAIAACDSAHPDECADGVARCAAKAGGNRATQVDLLKDVFGNPFRPVAADPSWLTSTVVALAEGIYQERAFDRLPILADALQDAGCEQADILDHCRSPGPHVRGCWVIDLLLGKS